MFIESKSAQIEVIGELGSWQLSTTAAVDKNGVEIIKISLDAPEKTLFPNLRLKWHVKKIDMQYLWHESRAFEYYIPAAWTGFYDSNVATSIPVLQLFNQQCENRFLVAVGETLRDIKMKAGVYEESNTVQFDIILFSTPEAPADHYETELYIDCRRTFYSDAIKDAMDFLRKDNPVKNIPDGAYNPVYSTWYNFHQNLFAAELEAECKEAVKYGIKTIIVDDGWQTDDNNRGYAFCGDWELSKRRFPDMDNHVGKIHGLGMDYMMWLSVPFMGEKSKNFDKFKNMLVDLGATRNTGTLDPRFPEVREFLIQTYERIVRDYNIDGLKLDFIDWFKFRGEDPAIKDDYNGRDIKSLPLAVDRLMTDVSERLRTINPDILIEFRQNYIGSAIQKYGNLLRALDCPNDCLSNRVRTLRLRMTSGDNAVHSDMLEWHADENYEIAALQFINIIFSVPQISIKFSEIPEEHKKMLKFYLDFWTAHKNTLMFGKLKAYHPEEAFPLVTAENTTEKIIAVYGSNSCIEAKNSPNIYIVNGSGNTDFVIDTDKIGCTVTIFNALGEKISETEIEQPLQKVKIPLAAIAFIG